MRLSAAYVMLSVQLLLVVFDLAYDLSSEYRSLSLIEPLYYNKQYSNYIYSKYYLYLTPRVRQICFYKFN